MSKFLSYMIILLLSVFTVLGQDVSPDEEVAVLETDYGKIVIKLYWEKAPIHAKNFKKLINEGFYDSLTFHRIIPGFVIQGGDPNSRDDDPYNDGKGGPGYTLPAEIGQFHYKGAVAMARLGDRVNPQKRSSGSQFYICLRPQPQLDQAGYSVFGMVIYGWPAIRAIAKVQTEPRRNSPLEPVYIRKAYMARYQTLKLKSNN